MQKQNPGILIIDDDSSDRYKLRKFLSKNNYKLSIAINGSEGYEKYIKENPQIIVTDWLMPELSGIELTKKIRDLEVPQPVIIFLSAVSSKSAEKMAINAGADYYLTKPFNRNKLLSIISNSLNNHTNDEYIIKGNDSRKRKKINFAGVGIAASTGGPPTVKYLIKKLGEIYDAVFFITQHGPSWMLQASVEFLQKETKLKVVLGADELNVEPGIIFIAPGNKHMIVGHDLKIHLLDTPPVNFVKPSADPMFKSIAEVFGNTSIGVVLTGMGSDGSIGCGYIFAEGGKIIVEDPSTAILHAMPESVIKLKLADVIVPIEEMDKKISQAIHEALIQQL